MDVGCTLYSGLRLDYSWGVGYRALSLRHLSLLFMQTMCSCQILFEYILILLSAC